MSAATPKRKLKINLSELEFAFENASWEMAYFLDLETGEVIMMQDDIRSQLEAIYEDAYNGENKVDLPAILAKSEIPGWQQKALLEADQVETGLGTHFIRVPQNTSREGYRDMERFIATISDERLHNRLWRAIQGRGAFRRFKSILFDYPAECERWFAFKGAHTRQRSLDWLKYKGIEPIAASDTKE